MVIPRENIEFSSTGPFEVQMTNTDLHPSPCKPPPLNSAHKRNSITANGGSPGSHLKRHETRNLSNVDHELLRKIDVLT